MSDRSAVVTLQASHWSGWDANGYTIVTYAKLRVEKGKILCPQTLGSKETGALFYEVTVERIVEDRVGFAFRNLVIDNPNGTINLTAPREGRFILTPGETKKLSTPTMDAGISVHVHLHEIR
jgi:hypothetical protein